MFYDSCLITSPSKNVSVFFRDKGYHVHVLFYTSQLILCWVILIWAGLRWQPTPVFLPGEAQGRGSLVGCRLWGRTESDTTEAT